MSVPPSSATVAGISAAILSQPTQKGRRLAAPAPSAALEKSPVPPSALVRSQPFARGTLGRGDLAFRHLGGQLAPMLHRFADAAGGGEIEPFVRRDAVGQPRAPAGGDDAELEKDLPRAVRLCGGGRLQRRDFGPPHRPYSPMPAGPIRLSRGQEWRAGLNGGLKRGMNEISPWKPGVRRLTPVKNQDRRTGTGAGGPALRYKKAETISGHPPLTILPIGGRPHD